MAVDVPAPRSRRAVMAGALGVLAAWATAALGRPNTVRGADGDPLTLGVATNAAGGMTVVSTSLANGLNWTTTGAHSVALIGQHFAGSGTGQGLHARSNSPGGIGASGFAAGGGTGVLGYSGSSFPTAPPKTGVFGQATQDANSRGVWGSSTSGRGVYGAATSGQGVRGFATSGSALYGAASTGYALRTSGRVIFEKSAGTTQVNAGSNSVVVTPGIDLTATSAVVATLQGNAGAGNAVSRVIVDPAANTFRIYLIANAANNVRVAWFVFG